MPQIGLSSTDLVWVRVAALLFTCVAFSVAANGAYLPHGGMADWCIFCWAFSFACTLLVLLVELLGLQTRAPVSWTNFPITVSCYACLLCLSASVIFPVFFLDHRLRFYVRVYDYRITSTVFSCLATVTYLREVFLTKARQGETPGYMATVPGLLKVCQTSVSINIIVIVSNPILYNYHPALQWCMAVYCTCFILSMTVVVLTLLESIDCLSTYFSKFLWVFKLLAVFMYTTATVFWPVFLFDKHYQARGFASLQVIAVTVLTALNFLLYAADLAYSAWLAYVSA